MREQTIEIKNDWWNKSRSPSGALTISKARPKPFDEKRFNYTVKEVAETLGVLQDTIYRWKNQGKLRFQPLPGRRTRFVGFELNEDLERLRCGSV